MKSTAERSTWHAFTLAACALGLVAGLAGTAGAGSVGQVSVTEVDEVQDAATIARAKAQFRSQNNDDEDSSNFSSSGCSDLNIGNVRTGVGQRVPRNVTVVIEGPVIQENNCR